MSAELGAQVGLIAPDETTRQWLAGVGAAAADTSRPAPADLDRPLHEWCSDEGAALTRHGFDADSLSPQVAAPHSPANAHELARYSGTPIALAYIGACTGAKLEDLRAAAEVLRGRHVAKGVRLLLAPASLRDQDAARQEGVLQVLLDAGAELLATSCGACAGFGASIEDGVTVISSTARNFKGRMGPDSVQVYLGSPYTVAASALCGRIADPREWLA
jgi:3-isopropylmalate/(R)-2-methylmalate dehydratase large subunit